MPFLQFQGIGEPERSSTECFNLGDSSLGFYPGCDCSLCFIPIAGLAFSRVRVNLIPLLPVRSKSSNYGAAGWGIFFARFNLIWASLVVALYPSGAG
jgi:hypothetical protein